MEQRKLPIGIQSFNKIRSDNYIYVDKKEADLRISQSLTIIKVLRLDSPLC